MSMTTKVGIPLTGPIIIKLAKMFHKDMNLSIPCKYSAGWHGISQLSIYGERASAEKNFVYQISK